MRNNNRKMVGAAVIAGVLGLAAIGGVQLASAGENAQAGGIVVVDGQRFNVSGCVELEINAGTVLCDGVELAPAEEGDADAAALALEAACDLLVAGEAAGEDAAEEDAAGEEAADEAAAGTRASRQNGQAGDDAAGDADDAGAGAEGAEEAAEDPAVTQARKVLLQACLDLGDAKAAAAEDAADDADAGAEGAEESAAPEDEVDQDDAEAVHATRD